MSEPMTPAEAAEYCGKKLATLNQYRYMGSGPTFYRTSPDKWARVFYLKEDLDKWLTKPAARRRTPFNIATSIRVDPKR